MRSADLAKPTVPISYVLQTLELAAAHGVSRDTMLKGTEVSSRMLTDPDARIGLLQYGQICVHALQKTGNAALGYEFGLRQTLTVHGFVGLGLMSQPTLRDAIEFVVRYYAPLRLPGWNLRHFADGTQVVVEARETVPYGVLRQYALDMMLVSLVSMLRPFLPPKPDLELWFDCAQPAYYPRYRRRLPAARFSMGVNQLRLPVKHLGLPIATANTITAQLVARECERELALLGPVEADTVLPRVRAALINERGRYPTLAAMAARLYLTPRTLVRHLGAHGASFQQLLDEARHRDGVRLLGDKTLTLSEIADRLGYSTAANFSRAFRKWTGENPGTFRAQMQRA